MRDLAPAGSGRSWTCPTASRPTTPFGFAQGRLFDRDFGLLDPLAFERQFRAFTRALVGEGAGPFVRVDGKTLRRSWTKVWNKTPVHVVSAFAETNRAALGQLATDAKSNEITAIPALLGMLALAGRTVTIDAMGCQREIARQIVDRGGHYILAVTGPERAPVSSG